MTVWFPSTARMAKKAEACKHEIEILTKDVEVGEVYEGRVTRILSTAKGSVGAFIEIPAGKEGLLHISKMAKRKSRKGRRRYERRRYG